MEEPIESEVGPDGLRGVVDAAEKAFDLALFLKLNEEYRSKPLIAEPRSLDAKGRMAFARQRAEMVDKRVGLKGKRVLEAGCGAGDMSVAVAREYGCEVVGVDIEQRPEWAEFKDKNLTLMQADIAKLDELKLARFDRIVSLVVWEHIKHPFTALKACRDLLKPDGLFYLRANLYRSPDASHRYREVFFPWPHLLFTDDVFRQFYRQLGTEPHTAAWVNRLTHAEYHKYFDLLGLNVVQEWDSAAHLDEDFYNRFEDVLSRYPVYDLTHRYINVALAIRAGDPANTWSEKALRKPKSRAFQLAERLSRTPKDLRYWLSLPLDALRIGLRKPRKKRNEHGG